MTAGVENDSGVPDMAFRETHECLFDTNYLFEIFKPLKNPPSEVFERLKLLETNNRNLEDDTIRMIQRLQPGKWMNDDGIDFFINEKLRIDRSKPYIFMPPGILTEYVNRFLQNKSKEDAMRRMYVHKKVFF